MKFASDYDQIRTTEYSRQDVQMINDY